MKDKRIKCLNADKQASCLPAKGNNQAFIIFKGLCYQIFHPSQVVTVWQIDLMSLSC
jgi:hypothetical protein